MLTDIGDLSADISSRCKGREPWTRLRVWCCYPMLVPNINVSTHSFKRAVLGPGDLGLAKRPLGLSDGPPSLNSGNQISGSPAQIMETRSIDLQLGGFPINILASLEH